MEKISLIAEERTLLGKKVKNLRKAGIIPGHVFGNNVETEHVSVNGKDFLLILKQAGETGLIELKIGTEKIRPVLIREVQYDPVKGELLHIDFYQVNLKEKVKVPVPIVLVGGDDIESIKMGETVILQTLGEVEVEALPTDLIENIEVNISPLKNVDDAFTVSQLNYDRTKITVLADPDEVVVKLAPAVTEEMKQLLEEQAAEAAAATEAAEGEEGEEAKEGDEETSGETISDEGVESEVPGEGGDNQSDQKSE